MASKAKNGRGEQMLRSAIIRRLVTEGGITATWAYKRLERSGLEPVAEYGPRVVFYDKAAAERWLEKEIRRGKAR